MQYVQEVPARLVRSVCLKKASNDIFRGVFLIMSHVVECNHENKKSRIMSIEQSHTNTEQSSDASNHMKKCQRSLQRGGIKGWQMISLTIGRDYWDCALILASSSGSASLLLQPLVIDTNISFRKFFYLTTDAILISLFWSWLNLTPFLHYSKQTQ